MIERNHTLVPEEHFSRNADYWILRTDTWMANITMEQITTCPIWKERCVSPPKEQSSMISMSYGVFINCACRAEIWKKKSASVQFLNLCSLHSLLYSLQSGSSPWVTAWLCHSKCLNPCKTSAYTLKPGEDSIGITLIMTLDGAVGLASINELILIVLSSCSSPF